MGHTMLIKDGLAWNMQGKSEGTKIMGNPKKMFRLVYLFEVSSGGVLTASA